MNLHKIILKTLAKSTSASAESILNELKIKKYAPLYFLQGTEPFFIDQVSDYIEKNILNDADKGFNQTILYGKDTTIGAVITAAKRYPMMADRQVVIVKEAQDVSDLEKYIKNKIAGKEVEYNALEEYARKPLPSTILVFCFKNKTLDGRKALAKVIDEYAVLLTSKGLYDNELPGWITNHIKSIGYQISEQAVRLLFEFVGNNLSRLSNEIAKIIINLKDEKLISDAHVLKFVGVSKEYNVFELQKALGQKNILLCNKIVKYFGENQKDNPIQMIIGNLFGYFSKLILVKVNKPTNDFEASKFLGVPPFIAKDYLQAASKYSSGQIINSIAFLRHADLASKGYGVGIANQNDGEIMKELVFKILHN